MLIISGVNRSVLIRSGVNSLCVGAKLRVVFVDPIFSVGIIRRLILVDVPVY